MPEIPSPEVALEDCQMNWDYAKKTWPPDGDGASFSGPWQTAVVTPTQGVALIARFPGTYLVTTYASGFISVAGQSLTIDVWVDGVVKGTMYLMATIPVTTRLMLVPLVFKIKLNAGTHFIGYQQTGGTSNTDDRGSMSIMRIA